MYIASDHTHTHTHTKLLARELAVPQSPQRKTSRQI